MLVDDPGRPAGRHRLRGHTDADALPGSRAGSAFALEDMHGNTHTLADYRGKVVVVNFWATWCPPCIKEMPSLERAWKQWRGEGIQVLAINMGDLPAAIEGFLQRYPVTFPVLLDKDVTVAKAWRVRGLPSTFIVDANGQRVWQAIGEREWDDPALLEQVRAAQQ